MTIGATSFFLVVTFAWALFSFLVVSRIRTVRYKEDKSSVALTVYLAVALTIIMATMIFLL